MNKRDLLAKIARWDLLIGEFDCVIKHRPGTQMRHVDALSRAPVVRTIINSY